MIWAAIPSCPPSCPAPYSSPPWPSPCASPWTAIRTDHRPRPCLDSVSSRGYWGFLEGRSWLAFGSFLFWAFEYCFEPDPARRPRCVKRRPWLAFECFSWSQPAFQSSWVWRWWLSLSSEGPLLFSASNPLHPWLRSPYACATDLVRQKSCWTGTRSDSTLEGTRASCTWIQALSQFDIHHWRPMRVACLVDLPERLWAGPQRD